MGIYQWSTNFVFGTITATSADAAFPAGNLQTIGDHPMTRRWRSTSSAQQDLVIDFGSTKTGRVALFGANFTTVTIAQSPDNSVYTNLAASHAVVLDPIDGIYKALTAESFSGRYLRVRIPSQARTDGQSVYELSLILPVVTLTQFPYSPQVGKQEVIDRPYLRSGTRVSPIGRQYLEEPWSMIFAPADLAQMNTFRVLGEHTPWFVYRNGASVAEIYVFRHTEPPQVTDELSHYTMSLRVKEML